MYQYTQPEYDAFGWSPLVGASIPMSETHGLDYESAHEATPRWFGVSSGNGNDGVSHIHPDYYVRTTDPFQVAELAMVHSFQEQYQGAVRDAMTVDGEADYTVTAELLNPLDDESEDGSSWSDANGAYMLVEVFPVDNSDLPDRNDPWHTPMYDSIAACFHVVARTPLEG